MGDMDVSTIKTMLKDDCLLLPSIFILLQWNLILKDLKNYLARGVNVMWFVLLVEESDHLEAKSAMQIADAMQRYFQNSIMLDITWTNERWR